MTLARALILVGAVLVVGDLAFGGVFTRAVLAVACVFTFVGGWHVFRLAEEWDERRRDERDRERF